jgi:hypothetical protein
MIIKELFDNPPKIKYDFSKDKDLYSASFKTSTNKKYNVEIVAMWMWGDETSNAFNKSYEFNDKDNYKIYGDNNQPVTVSFEDENGRTDSTGTGNSVQVFSAFYSIVKKYIDLNKPNALCYQALDPAREILYKKIFLRFPGYQIPIKANKSSNLFASFKVGIKPKIRK